MPFSLRTGHAAPLSFPALRPLSWLFIAVAAALALPPPGVAAAQEQELTITIRDHRFEPANPEIPAGVRVKLTVVNADKTAEEFESNDFHVEKIVGGGKTMSMFIGPLDPGTYVFFGERHESTAQGVLTVK
jgi:plastocyanin